MKATAGSRTAPKNESNSNRRRFIGPPEITGRADLKHPAYTPARRPLHDIVWSKIIEPQPAGACLRRQMKVHRRGFVPPAPARPTDALNHPSTDNRGLAAPRFEPVPPD